MTNRGDALHHEVQREELDAQVWSEPMVRLAERYGVSDVAPAKVCRKLEIPVPPRGYWRRIQTVADPGGFSPGRDGYRWESRLPRSPILASLQRLRYRY